MKDQLRLLPWPVLGRRNMHKHAVPRDGVTDHQNLHAGQAISPFDQVLAGRELLLADIILKRDVALELVAGSLRLAGLCSQCEQEKQRDGNVDDVLFHDMSPLGLVCLSRPFRPSSFHRRRARATKADERYLLFRSITRATIARVYGALASISSSM